MSNDLKPCPSCGSESVTRSKINETVYCTKCGMLAMSVSKWNTRAPVRVKLPPTIIADNDSETGRLRRQFTGQSQTMEVLDKALVIASLKAQGVEVVDGTP